MNKLYSGIVIENYKKKMAFTNSFAFIALLLLVAVANLCWFFLLPAKGEYNPIVKAITELERTIHRSEDSQGANWSILRKQIKKQQLSFSFLQTGQNLQHTNVRTLQKVYDGLAQFVEGNWRLYEIGEDGDSVRKYYVNALKSLNSIEAEDLSFKVTLEHGEKREIDLNNSVAGLKNLINEQVESLEATRDY